MYRACVLVQNLNSLNVGMIIMMIIYIIRHPPIHLSPKFWLETHFIWYLRIIHWWPLDISYTFDDTPNMSHIYTDAWQQKRLTSNQCPAPAFLLSLPCLAVSQISWHQLQHQHEDLLVDHLSINCNLMYLFNQQLHT